VSEAVILAGGLGTRLRAVVADRPKVLAPVAGRPFLHWLLQGLARQGVRRAVLATGYMADAVRDAVGESFAGIAIACSHEATPLGTGGAIYAALAHCTADRVLVLNGDSWLGLDLARFAAIAPAADLLLAARMVRDRARYGSVRADGDRLLGLDAKGTTGPGLINAGLYRLRRDLPALCPMPTTFSFESDVLRDTTGLDARVHETASPFIDIGTPEDFALAQSVIPRWAAA
jgi:D-glycero-alpha-D-manno-heptose 1-phosphate guanylyltransferase